MGRDPEPDERSRQDPQARDSPADGEDEHHGPSLATATALNVVINAVLNAGFGYGIAWLRWKDYELGWISHEAHEAFETAFVVEDLIVQGAATGVIVTLIVAAILHRQWDADHLEPGRVEALLLDGERTRTRHMAAWAGGTALAGAAFGGLVAALAVSGDHVSGSTFAAARAVNGVVVGGAVGGLVTASWVTNLSAGRLVRPPGDPNTLARIATGARRHAWPVLGVAVLATAALGAGVGDLEVDVDVAETPPRGNADADAARELGERFQPTHTQRVVFQFHVNAQRCEQDSSSNLGTRAPGTLECGNVTDEVYVRAMAEFVRRLRAGEFERETGVPGLEETEAVEAPLRHARGLPAVYRLANWTLAGGRGEASADAYALPDPADRVRWNAVEGFAERFLANATRSFVDPSYDQAHLSLALPLNASTPARDLGAAALEGRRAHLDAAPEETDWTVFADDNAPLHTVERPVANAHASQLAREDLADVAPLLGLVLAVGLAAAVPDLRGFAAASASASAGLAWTAGLVGHLGIPLGPGPLLAAPLVLGLAVDRSAHVVHGLRAARETGLEPDRAEARFGSRAGFAAFAATVVVALALAGPAAAPTRPLAELAGLSLLGLVLTLLAAVTVAPAALAVLPGPRRSPARWDRLGDLAALARRNRTVVAGLVLAVSALGVVGAAGLEEDPQGSAIEAWPEDDPLREEHERGLRGRHDVGDEGPAPQPGALAVEADLADPDTLAYLDRLGDELAERARATDALVDHDRRLLPSTIRTWVRVCCGPQTPPRETLTGRLDRDADTDASRYPGTRSEVRETLDAMFDSPYAALASPHANPPANNRTVVPIVTRADSLDGARAAQSALDEALARADEARPDGARAHPVGASAARVAESDDAIPWVTYAALAAAASAPLLALAFTREARVVLALAAAGALAGLGLAAGLAAGDVGLQAPLAFALASAIGLAAGAGLQVAWPLERAGDPDATVAWAGRASLVAGAATAAAFAVPGSTRLAGLSNAPFREAAAAAAAGAVLAGLLAPLAAAALRGETDPEAPPGDADP